MTYAPRLNLTLKGFTLFESLAMVFVLSLFTWVLIAVAIHRDEPATSISNGVIEAGDTAPGS